MSDEHLKRLMARLTTALEERAGLVREREAIVSVAKDEFRDDLNEEEDAEYRAKGDELKAKDKVIAELQARIDELADEEKRSEEAAAAQRRLKVVDATLRVNERRTYERGNETSYFKDLALAHIMNDREARARLERHAVDVATAKEYRDLTRTDGAGGYFVPPAWLIGQFAELARAGRVTANLVRNLPLPPNTDSINVPRITTGVATAIQTADNAAVQETDLVDNVATAPVRTIAGQQDIAIQLLEQSAVNFDEVIFSDLMRAYATNVGTQVLNGSGASGQITGLRTQAGTNAITYTDATPTVAELYAKLADAVNQIHTSRFASPNAIVMHPRRWAWFLAATDTQGRPLVVPAANGAQAVNPIGVNTAPAAQQALVGYVMGLPVYTDPNIPTNLGAGTNEDVILVLNADDALLWESAPRTRTLPDVGSGTLTVRLQVYGYVAFTAGRYPASTSIISGTGLVAPTF